jgi:hypothetical protein
MAGSSVLEHFGGVLPERDMARPTAASACHREQQDDQDAEPECRDGEARALHPLKTRSSAIGGATATATGMPNSGRIAATSAS